MTDVRVQDVVFSGIQAILFDKDGTLANSEPYLRKVGELRSHYIEQQVPGIQPLLRSVLGWQDNQFHPGGVLAVGSRRDTQTAAAACIAAQGRGWVEAMAIAQTAFTLADQALPPKAPQTQPFPDVLPLLQALQTANIRLGILSSDTSDQIQAFVETYQLDPYIQVIVGADCGLSKPDPKLFDLACDRLGVLPQHTLMVGDSEADLFMAKQANAAGGIGITGGWAIAPQLPSATVIIPHLRAIHL